jgi:hypothetical protein
MAISLFPARHNRKKTAERRFSAATSRGKYHGDTEAPSTPLSVRSVVFVAPNISTPGGGGKRFFLNVGNFIPDYTSSQPRGQ